MPNLGRMQVKYSLASSKPSNPVSIHWWIYSTVCSWLFHRSIFSPSQPGKCRASRREKGIKTRKWESEGDKCFHFLRTRLGSAERLAAHGSYRTFLCLSQLSVISGGEGSNETYREQPYNELFTIINIHERIYTMCLTNDGYAMFVVRTHFYRHEMSGCASPNTWDEPLIRSINRDRSANLSSS